MMSNGNPKNPDLDEILIRLGSMEERIAALESNKKLPEAAQSGGRKVPEETDSDFVNVNFSLSAPFETNFGEYGLAWLGNIVLFYNLKKNGTIKN